MTDSPQDAATNLIGADNMQKLKQASIAVVWEKDVKQNCKTCRYDNICSWNCWQGVRRPGYVYVTMAKARKSFSCSEWEATVVKGVVDSMAELEAEVEKLRSLLPGPNAVVWK